MQEHPGRAMRPSEALMLRGLAFAPFPSPTPGHRRPVQGFCEPMCRSISAGWIPACAGMTPPGGVTAPGPCPPPQGEGMTHSPRQPRGETMRVGDAIEVITQ